VAGLDSVHANLKNIYEGAQTLAATAISLDEAFEAEATRLKRQEAVRRLKSLRTTILEDLKRTRDLESTARYAQTKADAVISLTSSAIKLFTGALTDNPQTRNFVNGVFSANHHDKPIFGTVMVCVGAKGLPGDVRVISVSELARKSNRLESDVTIELREKGDLILSEEAFYSLMDKLTELVQEGCLVLPVSKEQVAELTTPSPSEWRAVQISG